MRKRHGKKHGASLLAAFVASSPATAQERALIWQPSRLGENAYSVRLGMALPEETGTKAGLDLGMRATEGGAVQEVPTRVWSSWSREAGDTVRRDVDMDFNVVTGSGTVKLSTTRKWIATPSLDVELLQAYSSAYDGALSGWNGVNTSHSVRLATSGGTMFTLRGVTSENLEAVRTGFGVQQKLGSHMTLSGDLDHADDVTNTRFTARYSMKW